MVAPANPRTQGGDFVDMLLARLRDLTALGPRAALGLPAVDAAMGLAGPPLAAGASSLGQWWNTPVRPDAAGFQEPGGAYQEVHPLDRATSLAGAPPPSGGGGLGWEEPAGAYQEVRPPGGLGTAPPPAGLGGAAPSGLGGLGGPGGVGGLNQAALDQLYEDPRLGLFQGLEKQGVNLFTNPYAQRFAARYSNPVIQALADFEALRRGISLSDAPQIGQITQEIISGLVGGTIDPRAMLWQQLNNPANRQAIGESFDPSELIPLLTSVSGLSPRWQRQQQARMQEALYRQRSAQQQAPQTANDPAAWLSIINGGR